MIRESVTALLACVVTFVLCAVVYPAVVWGLAQLLFPHQAEGSLIYGRRPNGDRLGADRPEVRVRPLLPSASVGRRLQGRRGRRLEPRHQQPRPAQGDRRAGRGARRRRRNSPVPVDLVTASGSGLDPDISPEAARLPGCRALPPLAGLPIEKVRDLIDRSRRIDRARSSAPRRASTCCS